MEPCDVLSMGNHIFIWSTLTAIYFIFLNPETPLYVQKKNLPIIGHRVHGTQNNRFEPMVSTKKSGLKYM